MQRTDTCCAQLEQQFNEARGSNDQRCNVIHADISGYGTAQELLLRNHYDLPLLPDAILLAVFPENDIRHHSRLQSADEPQPYFTLDDNNELRLDTGFRQSTVWLTAATTRRRVTRYSVRRSRLLQPFKRAKLRLWYLPVLPPIDNHNQPVAAFCKAIRTTHMVLATRWAWPTGMKRATRGAASILAEVLQDKNLLQTSRPR